MRVRKIASLFFILLWMIVIFLFSNQTAASSEANSDAFASKIIDIVAKISHKELTESRKKELIRETRFYVRKTAHFTLYFILDILVYLSLRIFGMRTKYCFLFAIFFCFLFACTDEFHQLFVDKRTGQFFDVLVDTSGACISSCLIGVYLWLKFEIKNLFTKK